MKDIQKHIILLFIFALAIVSFKAQNNFSSQEELKKEADRLFYEKQYDKCLPLFSQLLSNYPKDPNYNYKFGASQLFAESDKEKPLRFSKLALIAYTPEYSCAQQKRRRAKYAHKGD